MTRAVAEKGTELVQGTHPGHGGPAITIKQSNGLLREVPFDEDDGATPVLIEAMILSLEIEDPKLREAVRTYSLDFLREWSELVEDPEDAYNIPLDVFYTRAESFIAGYKLALGA